MCELPWSRFVDACVVFQYYAALTPQCPCVARQQGCVPVIMLMTVEFIVPVPEEGLCVGTSKPFH